MKKNFTGDTRKEESGSASVASVPTNTVKNIIKAIDSILFKRTKSITKKLANKIRFFFMKLNYLTPVNYVGSRIQELYSLIIRILKKKDGTSQR